MADAGIGEKPSGGGLKRAGAFAVVGLGVVANVVGIAGTVGNWGGHSTKIVLGATPAGAATAPSTTPSTAIVANATSTTAAPAQPTPQQFLTQLGNAETSGDIAFLIAHVHPAVLLRYGDAQCRSHFQATTEPTTYRVTGTPSAPASYVYTSDGRTTTITNVVAVPAFITAGSQSGNSTVHLAPLGGSYRIFVDCGTPIG